MKKLFLLGVLASCSAWTQADTSLTTPPKASVFAEYSTHKAEFLDNINADIDGFGIGISASPQQHGAWGKLEFLGNNDYNGDYYELSFGGHYNFLSARHYYIIGTLGAGIGLIDVPEFDDTVFFTIPVGLEAGINLNPNFSVYGGVGYKWAINISDDDKTRCNDGTTSNSTGSGTCSWHGGINWNYQPNYVGDFDGMTYKAGIRYNF